MKMETERERVKSRSRWRWMNGALLILLLGLIASTLQGVGAPEGRVEIDGIITSGEWEGSASIAFPYSEIHVLSDGTFLYLLLDIFGDTRADTADSFILFFDLDNDGRISLGTDLAYMPEGGRLLLGHYRSQSILGWEGVSLRSRVKAGFGTSMALGSTYPRYLFPHRIWEVAISLEELGIGPDDDLGFGLRVISGVPHLSYGNPFDFAHLIRGSLRGTGPFAIIGELDWIETSSLDRNSPEYTRSRAVALLKLPDGEWCTSFLVAQDILWTATHCLSNLPSGEVELEAVFNWEEGVEEAERESFLCDKVLASWPTPGAVWRANDWDVTLLRCRPGPLNSEGEHVQLPGERWGVLQLCDEAVVAREPIYLIHQNECWGSSPECKERRKLTDPGANPTKKISFGVIADPHFSEQLFTHDADTLGGSSGAPIFDPETGYVIGYHRGYIRGKGLNAATAIWEIKPVLEREGLWVILAHC